MLVVIVHHIVFVDYYEVSIGADLPSIWSKHSLKFLSKWIITKNCKLIDQKLNTCAISTNSIQEKNCVQYIDKLFL